MIEEPHYFLMFKSGESFLLIDGTRSNLSSVPILCHGEVIDVDKGVIFCYDKKKKPY
jgi:hypothetical protein